MGTQSIANDSAPAQDWQSATELPFEPLPQFRQNALEDSAERADCCGKRIGIFIVTYNAVTTLNKVLRRITPHVWRNVEQVVVADDASQDATFELAVGIQALRNLSKLKVLKHPKNLGYGGNQKAGYQYFIEQGLILSCFCMAMGNMRRSCCRTCIRH